MNLMEKISIAIPTYNSSKFIKESIPKIYKTSVINEIIIHDDCSNEDDFEDIQRFISKYKKNKKINLKIFRNSSNIGGFKNKYLAVEKCENNIVYQMDSDNILSNSFSKFFDSNFLQNFDNCFLLFGLSIAITITGTFGFFSGRRGPVPGRTSSKYTSRNHHVAARGSVIGCRLRRKGG